MVLLQWGEGKGFLMIFLVGWGKEVLDGSLGMEGVS